MRFRIYTLQWGEEAKKQFHKIKNKKLQERILDVLENEITHNPLSGKPLTFQFKGFYSYRVGHLRIIYNIEKETLIIFVVNIEHRKDVYRIR